MNSPKVSICIPTYNGEQFIHQAIMSVLNQTLSNFELIVSDDSSSDNTREIVTGISDPRLRFVANENRLGLVGNWNRCIDLATAPYLCIFHQDDVMQLSYLQRALSVLDQLPSTNFVFSDIKLINEAGQVIGGHWTPVLPAADTVYAGNAFCQLLFSAGNLVPCSTVTMRGSCLRDWGYFNARLRYTPDLEMWLRLSLHGDVAYLAEPLVSLRRHISQESTHFMGQPEEIEEVWRAFSMILTEQRQFLLEPDRRFELALTHLQAWTVWFLRCATTRLQLRVALRHVAQLVRFMVIKRRKLSRLTSFCRET
jgi:GT2 family glycosyltransferase